MDKSSAKNTWTSFYMLKNKHVFPPRPSPPKKNRTGLVRSWQCLAALALPHLPQLEREAGGPSSPGRSLSWWIYNIE